MALGALHRRTQIALKSLALLWRAGDEGQVESVSRSSDRSIRWGRERGTGWFLSSFVLSLFCGNHVCTPVLNVPWLRSMAGRGDWELHFYYILASWFEMIMLTLSL